MQGSAEELRAEPQPMSRQLRAVLGGSAAVLVCLFLLNGSQRAECGSPTYTPAAGPSPASPWLTSDDPLVRAMHFSVLDRPHSRADTPPTGVLSADLIQTARKVGDDAGIAVYLADGPGFVCLGVDGRRANYSTTRQCMLNVSVANQGLSVSITANDEPASNVDPVNALENSSILVVAVPDHAQLLTPASTKPLATYTNASVLRPEENEIVLQQGAQEPVVINRSSETTFLTSC